VFWKAPLANFDGRHAWSLPDRIEFGHAQPCFFFTVWFQRERCEALQSVAIIGHGFSPMVKLVAENDMEVEE
jgi:hypothetical protein